MAKIKYLTGTPVSRATNENINRKELIQAFTIIDKRGVRWHVPKGTISDGKSVPESLEPFVGDPFEGVTEAAAWVHDHYCVTKTRSQKDTHRIFRELVYDAMRSNSEYGWARWPWNMHNSKLWQYQRCKLMWFAVRAWNRIRHLKWK